MTVFVRKWMEAGLQHPFFLSVPGLSPSWHLAWLLLQEMRDFLALSNVAPPPCGPEVQGRWLTAADSIASLATEWICIKLNLRKKYMKCSKAITKLWWIELLPAFHCYRHWNQAIFIESWKRILIFLLSSRTVAGFQLLIYCFSCVILWSGDSDFVYSLPNSALVFLFWNM